MWEAVAGSMPPPTVWAGHSMGGAIAVHAAASQRIHSLAGLVVVDVVEGTALQVLLLWARLSDTCNRRMTCCPTILTYAGTI